MFEQLKKILSRYTEADITETSTLEADLGFTSFEVVSVINDVEEIFNIEIAERDIGKFTTVSDILEYLAEHCKNS